MVNRTGFALELGPLNEDGQGENEGAQALPMKQLLPSSSKFLLEKSLFIKPILVSKSYLAYFI